jgi:hypothetical protein
MAGNRSKLPASQGRSRSPQTSSHPPLRRAPRRERPAVLQLSGTFGPGPRRCDPALQTRPGAIRHQILSSLRRAMLAHRTRKEGGRREGGFELSVPLRQRGLRGTGSGGRVRKRDKIPQDTASRRANTLVHPLVQQSASPGAAKLGEHTPEVPADWPRPGGRSGCGLASGRHRLRRRPVRPIYADAPQARAQFSRSGSVEQPRTRPRRYILPPTRARHPALYQEP